MKLRYLLFRSLVYSGLFLLTLAFFRTQVLEGRRYRKLSEQNRIRLIPLEARRGRIFDAKGRLLATNRPSYDVVATPEDVTPEVFPMLAKILGISEATVRERMSAPREYPFAPAVIEEDVSREVAFQIEERRYELPGVKVRVSFLRYYPYGMTASHIVGYLGKINRDEYERLDRKRYGMNSWVGRFGIEKIFDEKLRGFRGGRQIEVNARGQFVRLISEKVPVPGEDLQLTLDLELQERIMERIKGKRAAVAILDLHSEGLLILASSPAFDPNVFVMPGHSRERLQFLRDREAPLLDRGVSSAYPPGSVFKLVTALAGLETGKISPHTRFHCNGEFRLRPGTRPFHCWRKEGHGTINLYEAIERSCNVYFYNVAARLSPDEIAHYARELGLGKTMELEVSRLTPGLVPDTAWKKEKYGEKWYQGETLSFAIGQSYLQVSPLQILRLTAIIARDGEDVRPHLVLETSKRPRHQQRRKIAIHKENLKVIQQAMLQVVQSPYGTGQLARVDFGRMAGKSGTAQAPPKEPHSWMTGFFPYKDPEIAFVVFVEHGGSGGITSARIVKDMLQIWRAIYGTPAG